MITSALHRGWNGYDLNFYLCFMLVGAVVIVWHCYTPVDAMVKSTSALNSYGSNGHDLYLSLIQRLQRLWSKLLPLLYTCGCCGYNLTSTILYTTQRVQWLNLPLLYTMGAVVMGLHLLYTSGCSAEFAVNLYFTPKGHQWLQCIGAWAAPANKE